MTDRRDLADSAIRVAATATRTRYDATSIALHWATVVLVLLNFATAELWGLFARPTRHLMIVSHMSFGILLSVVVVARIVWRLVPGHQVEPASRGWDERLAKGAQYLLYLLLLAQSALGYIVRWSEGQAMSFFGLLIRAPFAPMTKAEHHTLMERHNVIGWMIIVLAAGHAAAAIYHHFVLRDRVLERMLPRGRVEVS
ncbi:MAG TPA: cytochrome b/b6 domain-containing protein [Allosphingosinicella sp.]|jgi:cytochrome b561